MALTFEQFKELRNKGLSVEQIKKFDSGEIPVEKGYSIGKLGEDILKGTRDILTLPADFLNQLAFDVPRQALEGRWPGSWEANFGDSMYEPLQKAGGVAGAVIGGSKLNQAIRGLAGTSRAFNTTLGGSRVATGGKLPNILVGNTASGVATGAVEGAIRQENAEYTPKSVAEGAALGATLGAAIPTAQAIGRKAQRLFSGIPKTASEVPQKIVDFFMGEKIDIKARIKPEDKIRIIKQEGRRLGRETSLATQAEKETISGELEKKTKELAERKDFLRKRSLDLGRNRAEQTAIYQEGMREIKNKTKEDLSTTLSKIDNEVKESVISSTKDIQESLPKMFREASAKFGAHLEEIDRARRLTALETKQFFVDALNDSAIKGGRVFEIIKEKASKYGLRASDFVADEAGNISITKSPKSATIKELFEDIKEIGSNLSSGAKSGDRFSQNDIPYAVLQDKLASFSPELSELRSSYKPVLLAMKQASRVFKPRLGDAGTRSAELFLKRVAKGGMSNQDKWLIKMISEPTGFTTGIGGVTDKLSILGKTKEESVAIIEKATKRQMESIRNKYQRQMAASADDKIKTSKELIDLGKELRELREQSSLAKKAVNAGKIESEKDWQNRLRTLASREEKLLRIREKQAKAKALRDSVAWAGAITAGVAGAAGIGYGISRGVAAGSAFERLGD